MPFRPSFVNGFVQISAVVMRCSLRSDGARFYQLASCEYSLCGTKFTFSAKP
ncbi:DUF2575 family protein [Cronobacter turicensis]|nr:DUF2575 family protein [Cronobacter turicensis]